MRRPVMVPLRQRISDENLLRYNGMLIGVFELLADARDQIGAVNAAIDARREFWLADADLQQALLGRPGSMPAAARTPPPPPPTRVATDARPIESNTDLPP